MVLWKEDIIPMDIINICFQFYHFQEYFDPISRANEVSKGNRTIAKIFSDYSWYNTTYGHTLIAKNKQCRVIWTLKINQLNAVMCIGIYSGTEYPVSFDFNDSRECKFSKFMNGSYAHYSSGELWRDGRFSQSNHTQYKRTFKQGDIIEYTLDTRKKKLYFTKRYSAQKIVLFENIRPYDYNLAVSLFRINDSITMLSHYIHMYSE